MSLVLCGNAATVVACRRLLQICGDARCPVCNADRAESDGHHTPRCWVPEALAAFPTEGAAVRCIRSWSSSSPMGCPSPTICVPRHVCILGKRLEHELEGTTLCLAEE